MSLIKEGHSIAKIMSATKSVVSLLVGIAMDPNRKIVAAVSSYFKPTVFDRVDFIEMYCCRLYNSPAFRRHKVWKMKFILIYNRISECSQMDSLAKRIEWGNIQ